MQQYLLSIYQPDGEAPPPARLRQIMVDVRALVEEIKQADAWVFNAGLQPVHTARVVRDATAGVLVTDGPYIESKEHIGGFLIVRTGTPDAAVEWAAKLARAIALPIEVRPFQGDTNR